MSTKCKNVRASEEIDIRETLSTCIRALKTIYVQHLMRLLQWSHRIQRVSAMAHDAMIDWTSPAFANTNLLYESCELCNGAACACRYWINELASVWFQFENSWGVQFGKCTTREPFANGSSHKIKMMDMAHSAQCMTLSTVNGMKNAVSLELRLHQRWSQHRTGS